MQPRNYSSNVSQVPPSPSGRYTKKRIVLGVIGIVVVMAVFTAWRVFVSKPQEKSQSKNDTNKVINEPDRVRLIATGDTIAHDALNAAAKTTEGYDYYQFMKPMQAIFDKADVRFCNQAVPSGGEAFGIDGFPIFNSPLEVATDMQKLGCNVINTGTNHTFDKGQAVVDAQQNHWDSLPNILATAGANRSEAEKQKVRYFESKGIKFAFVSYSTYSNITPPNSYGLTVYSDELAKQQITEARANADIVLVSMRWGTEYSPNNNAVQDKISTNLAQWGADIVLGHGPHVLQPMRKFNGSEGRTTYVWYSLGNFLNAQIEVETLVNGVAVMDIDVASKKITDISFLPIYMHYEWTPQEKAREDLLSRRAFTLVPLDKAQDLLSRSQNNTTIDAQIGRITNVFSKYDPVRLVTSDSY